MSVGPIGSIWFQRRRLNIKVYRQWRRWQTQSYDSTSHDPLGKKWAKKPSTI
jgi:predicted alpha/beta hydrolase